MPESQPAATRSHDALDEPFDIGEVYSLGWSLMSSHYGLLLGITIIFVVVNITIGGSLSILQRTAPAAAWILNLSYSFLLGPPLTAGIFFVGVRLYREENVGVEAMFAGFSRYWVVVGINVLLAFLVICCLIPGGVIIGVGAVLLQSSQTAGMVTMIIGVAISLALVIVVSIRLAYAAMACLDPENGYPGVLDSLTLSWRATHPIAGRLLLLYLLVSLTIMATILLACVGVLFVGYPFGLAVYGVAYVAVFGPLHRALDADERFEEPKYA